jgi:hypothetical protein
MRFLWEGRVSLDAGFGNVVWMFEKYLLKPNANGVCPLTVQIGEVL